MEYLCRIHELVLKLSLLLHNNQEEIQSLVLQHLILVNVERKSVSFATYASSATIFPPLASKDFTNASANPFE